MMNTSLSLDIVIPAYNEEVRLGPTLEDLIGHFECRKEKVKIIIILNGCTDATEALASSYQRRHPQLIAYYIFKERLGKGGAILEGLKISQADLVSFSDADGAVPSREVTKLCQHLGHHDAIIGSRHLPHSKILIQQSRIRTIAGRVYNLLVRLLIRLPFKDTQCGGKILTRNAAQVLLRNSDFLERGWSFDVALLRTLREEGFSVKEHPVEWINGERSKIRLLKDGLIMLVDLIRMTRVRSRRRYRRILMIQHNREGHESFLRCLHLAENIANKKRHVAILCFQEGPGWKATRIKVHPENTSIKVICFPSIMEKEGWCSSALKCIQTWCFLLMKREVDLYYFYDLKHLFGRPPLLLLKWKSFAWKSFATDLGLRGIKCIGKFQQLPDRKGP